MRVSFLLQFCYMQLLFRKPVLKQDENQPAYTYAIHMPGFMVELTSEPDMIVY